MRGLVVLDADGDGFSDIVTANRVGNNVSIIMNNGNGTFSSPTNFEGTGDGETAAATADVNADGIMDIFIGSLYSNEVILWLGDGNGSFSFRDDIIVGTTPWMVVSGDVNKDGIPDVVSANSNGPSFSIVLCDASGNLISSTNYPVGAFPVSVDLGDLDGDLDLDIVTSNFTGGNFTMYENNGTGVFVNRTDIPSNQAGTCAVFHDRDNDGDMDMTGIDEMQDLLILFTNRLVPVPVELSSFNAKVINEKIQLKWVTKTEVNNYGFDIERNANETGWKKIGFVPGFGNSNSPKSYSFTDNNVTGGSKFQYRLKQIDTDGQYKYSEAVEAEIIPEDFALCQNYPNPFNPGTKISFVIDHSSFVSLKVYDVLGNEVAVLIEEEKPSGEYEVEFNVEELSSGMYLYTLKAGSYSETKKMLLLK